MNSCYLKIEILIVLFIGFLCPLVSSSQLEISDSKAFVSRIVDVKTHEAIPYANVYNLSAEKGTISNFEGLFTLRRSLPSDSIRISFIGYETLYFLLAEIVEKDTIYLKTRTELLSELRIYGDYAFLYDLFAKAAKTTNNKELKAKTYFSLETFIDTVQVEWLEGYYNGIYKGYEMDDLNLKNGRIALVPNGLKYFVSLESSKAQYMHRIFEFNAHYPKSPFEFSKKKTKENFDLKLANSYKDDEDKTIIVVDFKPKLDSSLFYSGRVWLDSLSGNVQKVSLHCYNAQVHPYSPIWANDNLIQVDLFFVKTFKKVKDKMYVDAIDYTYNLKYENWKKERYQVSTHNMLFAYDYTTAFDLPLFDFGLNEENDYRKVNTAPYNAFFWEFIDEFTRYDRSENNKKFILKASKDDEVVFLGNNDVMNHLFSRSYLYWSEERLRFDESGMKFHNDDVKSVLATDMYKIEMQIYLDINYLNDSLQCISKTIFDPFDSYYYFLPDNKSAAFLNMYFDFVEIQRLKMDEALKKADGSAQKAKRIYKNKMVELGRLSVAFFRDVNRGNDKEGMLKWNDYIVKGLGIDNWEIFELFYEFD